MMINGDKWWLIADHVVDKLVKVNSHGYNKQSFWIMLHHREYEQQSWEHLVVNQWFHLPSPDDSVYSIPGCHEGGRSKPPRNRWLTCMPIHRVYPVINYQPFWWPAEGGSRKHSSRCVVQLVRLRIVFNGPSVVAKQLLKIHCIYVTGTTHPVGQRDLHICVHI